MTVKYIEVTYRIIATCRKRWTGGGDEMGRERWVDSA
jgi:hypothetical protein